MNIYAKEPLGFWGLLGESLRGFPRIFEYAWYLVLGILILAVITALIIPVNLYVGLTVLILMVLAIIFIIAITLHMGNTALLGKPADVKKSIENAKRGYLTLLGGVVLLLGVAAFTALIDFALLSLGSWSGWHLLFVIIASIFSLFIALLFYFVFPLIILENDTVWKSFEKSCRIFWINGWRVGGVLILVHLLTLLLTALGMIFIPVKQMYLVYIIYIFVIQLIIYPLIISAILVLLHDANLRLGEKNEPHRHKGHKEII